MKVRKFNKLGLQEVRNILEKVRQEGDLCAKQMFGILTDSTYTNLIDEKIEIDPDQLFETKLDMVNYLMPILSNDFLEKYKRDSGVWTWIAIAYYGQLQKRSKKAKIENGAVYCWVYNYDQFRESRRHFIAGPMYLYYDFCQAHVENIEVFFSAPPNEFGGFIDAVSYKEEFARIPAMLQVASWLYYDSEAKNKIKRGATGQGKPGTIRELTRMSDHFAMTYDIFNVEDAGKFWNLLPAQFNRFKGNAQH